MSWVEGGLGCESPLLLNILAPFSASNDFNILELDFDLALDWFGLSDQMVKNLESVKCYLCTVSSNAVS